MNHTHDMFARNLRSNRQIIKVVASLLVCSINLAGFDSLCAATPSIHQLPGVIQAEAYREGGEGVGFHDTTPGNEYGFCRNDGVDIKQGSDRSGNCVVGLFQADEWLAYNTYLEQAGEFKIDLRVSRGVASTGGVHIEVDGTNLSGTIPIPSTGSWEVFDTVQGPIIHLTAGEHEIRLINEVDWVDVNWLEFSNTESSGGDGETSSDVHLVPGVIQAEDYRGGGEGVGFHDFSPGNEYGFCRDDSVDIKEGNDTSGDCVVGLFQADEWLAYNIRLAQAGDFNIDLRVSRGVNTTGRARIEVDGVNLSGSIPIPSTGGWEIFDTVHGPAIHLPAGEHEIRLVNEADWMDINWLEFRAAEPAANSPNLPDLTTDDAITVGCSDDLAALAVAAPEGAVFYLPDCTYTNVFNVNPKNGQRFIGQSQSGVIILGNPQTNRAFTGNSDNVVIANMTIRNYGSGNNQNEAPIVGNTGNSSNGSPAIADDWHIYQVSIADNGNSGIIMGNRWTIQNCSFYRNNPTGLGGSRGVGGWIADSYFEDNGTDGATGWAVNNAQIKIAWWNVGPWGDPARDSSTWVDYHGNDLADQTEPNDTLRMTGNTFEGSGLVRGIWFDLDVRDTEVSNNTFNNASTFGVFYEGSNNGWVHHNTFNNSGTWWGAPTASAYVSSAAVSTGSSDNILVEENVFNDCPGSLLFFLGERGRNGGDWVTSYPVATTDWGGQSNQGQGYMIVNSFAPIGPTDRSSVGSSNLIARNNTFNGNSRYVGYLLDSDINSSTEANMNTVIFSGNTYSTTQTNGSYFIWGHDTQNFSQWQAGGRQ
jgi:hypothetical protein